MDDYSTWGVRLRFGFNFCSVEILKVEMFRDWSKLGKLGAPLGLELFITL